MRKYQDIWKETDRGIAFQKIADMEISGRQKAVLRLQWKKKHHPDEVKPSPQKGRRRQNQEKSRPVRPDPITRQISSIKKQIENLQAELAEMLKKTQSDDSLCSLCGKDPEGYDLPCRHEICKECFDKLMDDDRRVSCPTCSESFLFDVDI